MRTIDGFNLILKTLMLRLTELTNKELTKIKFKRIVIMNTKHEREIR